MVFDRFGKKVITDVAKMLLWCNLLIHWWFYYFCEVIKTASNSINTAVTIWMPFLQLLRCCHLSRLS